MSVKPTAAIEARLLFADDVWPGADLDKERLVRQIKAITDSCGKLISRGQNGNKSGHSYELTILLSDNAYIRRLNYNYRNIDRPTNVLAFPPEAGDHDVCNDYLGDIVIAYETIVSEAKAQAKTINDHLMHLITHGILHLMGYDHDNRDKAEIMEKLETEILAQIGISDPYRDVLTGD